MCRSALICSDFFIPLPFVHFSCFFCAMSSPLFRTYSWSNGFSKTSPNARWFKVPYAGYSPSPHPPGPSAERRCTMTGGSVRYIMDKCNIGDFADTCMPPTPCAMPDPDPKMYKRCDCPDGSCFNSTVVNSTIVGCEIVQAVPSF